MHRTSQSQSVLSLIAGKNIFNNITSQKYTPDEARAVTSIKDGVSCFPGQIWIAHKKPRTERQTWASGRAIVILSEENMMLVWSDPLVFPHLGINSARPLI